MGKCGGRRENLLFSIRAGGHNVSGAAIADSGLVIDLSQMRGVKVDSERRVARVEGGARLGDIDQATAPYNLAAPVGVVSETGVAGLTLHGGAGWQLRKHGLSIDNLLAVDVVTADGSVIRADEENHPDLFWALRGGGGNFGVVTSFEFRLRPIPSKVWMNVPIYPLDRAGEVLAVCRDYMAEATEDLMVLGVCWTVPEEPDIPEEHHGKPCVILLGCFSGPEEEAEKVLAPLLSIVEPIADLSAPMSWVEAQTFLDADYPDGICYYWKAIYLSGLTGEVMEILARHTRNRPSPESSIDIWFLGGALARVPADATAFSQRSAPIMIGIEANWHARKDADANIEWARALYKNLEPYSNGGNYLNFPGFIEDRQALLQGAYGANLPRLQRIKGMYDPDNIFQGLLNISPQN